MLGIEHYFFMSVPSVASVLKLFFLPADWKHPAVHAKLDAVQS